MLLGLVVSATALSVASGIDWREYVSRGDMLWDGPKLETLNWLQGPFAGNGLLGTLITVEKNGCGTLYPGCSTSPHDPVLRVKVGRTDVWDTRVRGSKYSIGDQQYDTPRLPIGNLFIAPTTGAMARVGFRCNLYDANVTAVAYGADNGTLFNFTLWVAATTDIIVVDVYPPGAAAFTFLPDRAVPPVCSSDPFDHTPTAGTHGHPTPPHLQAHR